MLRFEVIAAIIIALFVLLYVLTTLAPNVLPAEWLEALPF
jgi:hypothetical protein